MRVVGGIAKGRRIQAPSGSEVRPTSDRARQALFTMLDARLGGVEDLVVADLACGSGALGIEALSRGAARATFVEQDRRALECIFANLSATGLESQSTVVRSEAVRFLAGAGTAFDVAFVDPPYAFDEWDDVLGCLRSTLVVCEASRTLDAAPGWQVLRSDRYGTTVVTLLHRTEVQKLGEP